MASGTCGEQISVEKFWFVGAACLVVHLFACWVWGAIWHQ